MVKPILHTPSQPLFQSLYKYAPRIFTHVPLHNQVSGFQRLDRALRCGASSQMCRSASKWQRGDDGEETRDPDRPTHSQQRRLSHALAELLAWKTLFKYIQHLACDTSLSATIRVLNPAVKRQDRGRSLTEGKAEKLRRDHPFGT